MGYKEQIEKEIREAYIFLRKNNQSIPSETLELMLNTSLNSLNTPELLWTPFYSETDEPDKMGRWARMAYYKGLTFAWVSKFSHQEHGDFYNTNLYFPIGYKIDPTIMSPKSRTWEEAKERVEVEFKKFIERLNEH